jgi:hypothetical protein
MNPGFMDFTGFLLFIMVILFGINAFVLHFILSFQVEYGKKQEVIWLVGVVSVDAKSNGV